MNCLRIRPPAGDRSRARTTGLLTRIIAAGGCADSTGVALCPVMMPAYARTGGSWPNRERGMMQTNGATAVTFRPVLSHSCH